MLLPVLHPEGCWRPGHTEASSPGPSVEPGMGVQWCAPEPWLRTTPLCSLLSFSGPRRILRPRSCQWNHCPTMLGGNVSFIPATVLGVGQAAVSGEMGPLPRTSLSVGDQGAKQQGSQTMTFLWCAGVSVGLWEGTVRFSRVPAAGWQFVYPPRPPGNLHMSCQQLPGQGSICLRLLWRSPALQSGLLASYRSPLNPILRRGPRGTADPCPYRITIWDDLKLAL